MGNYTKTSWRNGDIISEGKLNKIEDGIYQNSLQVTNIVNNLKLVSGTNNSIKLMLGERELSSVTIDGTVTPNPPTPDPVDPNLEGLLKDRLLVWHDEFDGETLDTSKWRYATHNSGGSEQQAYTIARTENVRLENSKLILEAKKDGYVSGYTWSSGRIDTSGLCGFKYGRLEAKLRYDVVSGAFPAFWTIGTCAYYPTGENIHGVQKK